MTKKVTKFDEGIKVKPTDNAPTTEGEIKAGDTDKKIKTYIDGAARDVVTADQTQTLTNKDIDADTNTVQNLETDNLKAGVLNTDLSGPATDTELPSALAVKTALEGQNEASEITYDPTGNPETTATNVQDALDDTGTASQAAQQAVDDHIADATDAHTASALTNVPSGNLAATDVQGALDELQTDVDTRALDSDLTAHINDATDAHTASAITNVPSGNLAATDVQGAVNELQTDVDTRALDIDLSNHIADTSTHGVTEIIGSIEAQELSNKTFTNPNKNNIQQSSATGSVSLSNPTAPVVEFTGAITELIGITDSGNQEVTLINRSGNPFTIKNEDGGAAASIRILTGTGKDLELADNQAIKLQYSSNESRWNVIGGTGSGSGTGGINYLEGDNTNFEGGIGDWTGDSNIAIAQETTNILRGEGSLRITKDSDVSGQSITSPTFTVDAADLAKKLTISFDYDFDDADYTDGMAQVRIIQDPDGTPSTIRVNGEDIKAGKGTHYAQFQTDSTQDEYALEIYWDDNTAADVNVYIDNVVVGPTNLAFGTIQTDWEDYTPIFTNLGTVSGVNFQYRRDGQDVLIRGEFQTGTVPGASGSARFSTPSGIVTDTTVASLGIGDWRHEVSSTSPNKSGTLQIGGSTIAFTDDQSTVASSGTSFSAPNSGVILNNNARVTVDLRAKVVGWSSNAKMSEDLGGRDVIVEGAGNSGATITASVTDIDFTETRDTTASFDGTTFTAPEAGSYIVTGRLFATASVAIWSVLSYVNGSLVNTLGRNDSDTVVNFSGTISLQKGDTFTIRSSQGFTESNSTVNHWIHIQKLASPQTILETETVAFRAEMTSGQAINHNSQTTILFNSILEDTHNAYNPVTGLYTIPTNGFYIINGSNRFSFNGTVSTILNYLYKNTTLIAQDSNTNAGVANTYDASNSIVVYCEKGDTIRVDCFQNNTIPNLGLLASSSTRFSLARIK